MSRSRSWSRSRRHSSTRLGCSRSRPLPMRRWSPLPMCPRLPVPSRLGTRLGSVPGASARLPAEASRDDNRRSEVTTMATATESLFSLTGAWQHISTSATLRQHRRTKIVCTLGPAASEDGGVEELARAGMDAARLNFSHGSHDDHLDQLRAVRLAQEAVGRPLAVIADLCGPKIRIERLSEPRSVQTGDLLTLAAKASDGDLGVTFADLHRAVEPGSAILINDGRIRARVVAVDGERVSCRVEIGGVISSGKGVNLPGAALAIPALTAKDLVDLEFALAHGVDYVALSFVQSAEDVLELRERIESARSNARIIAKIEKAEAIRNLDAIIAATDAVMVARGDLGVEIGVAEVPLLQKLVIAKARAANRTVITATQMLESMIDNAEPTRAEASDVANAIMDGTSAVMLSGETAVGKHPIAAVEMMDRIARAVEPSLAYDSTGPRGELETAAILPHARSRSSGRGARSWQPAQTRRCCGSLRSTGASSRSTSTPFRRSKRCRPSSSSGSRRGTSPRQATSSS